MLGRAPARSLRRSWPLFARELICYIERIASTRGLTARVHSSAVVAELVDALA